MSQRHTVSGRRSALIWLSIVVGLALVVALVVIVLFIYPQYQRQQQVEQHYQAGMAFQDAGDWDRAVDAFEKVVATDATYRDARPRLVEVKAKQREALAMAQTEASEAMATATNEALTQLEADYQKGLGYINLKKWIEAKTELEQVFEEDPNYREVQAKLAEVEAQLKEVQALTPTPTSNLPTPNTKRAGSTYHAEDGAFVRVQGLVAEVVLSEFRFDDVSAGDVEVIATLMGSVERGASETGSAWIEINGVRLDQVPTHVLPRETLAHQLTLHGRLQNFTGGRLTVFIKASTEASTAHFKFGVENGDGRFGRHVTVVAGL